MLVERLGLSQCRASAQEPPKEFRVLRGVRIQPPKGPLKLTPEGAQQIIERYKDRAVVKCFDYFTRPMTRLLPGSQESRWSVSSRSARRWPLVCRYPVDANAAKAIRDGEWPYISPAVVHTKDGVIIDLKTQGACHRSWNDWCHAYDLVCNYTRTINGNKEKIGLEGICRWSNATPLHAVAC